MLRNDGTEQTAQATAQHGIHSTAQHSTHAHAHQPHPTLCPHVGAPVRANLEAIETLRVDVRAIRRTELPTASACLDDGAWHSNVRLTSQAVTSHSLHCGEAHASPVLCDEVSTALCLGACTDEAPSGSGGSGGGGGEKVVNVG